MKKNIGKPCTGKPYARFDEGGQVSVAMVGLLRHRQTKEAATDRFDLLVRDACLLLYPMPCVTPMPCADPDALCDALTPMPRDPDAFAMPFGICEKPWSTPSLAKLLKRN